SSARKWLPSKIRLNWSPVANRHWICWISSSKICHNKFRARSFWFAALKRRWSFCKVSPSWLLSLGDSTIVLSVAFFYKKAGSDHDERCPHIYCRYCWSGFFQAAAHEGFARLASQVLGCCVLVAVGHPLLRTG